MHWLSWCNTHHCYCSKMSMYVCDNMLWYPPNPRENPDSGNQAVICHRRSRNCSHLWTKHIFTPLQKAADSQQWAPRLLASLTRSVQRAGWQRLCWQQHLQPSHKEVNIWKVVLKVTTETLRLWGWTEWLKAWEQRKGKDVTVFSILRVTYALSIVISVLAHHMAAYGHLTGDKIQRKAFAQWWWELSC